MKKLIAFLSIALVLASCGGAEKPKESEAKKMLDEINRKKANCDELFRKAKKHHGFADNYIEAGMIDDAKKEMEKVAKLKKEIEHCND